MNSERNVSTTNSDNVVLHFLDLLRSSSDISIHQICINSLLTEVYKYFHGISPEIMNKAFSGRANIYNKWQFNVFQTHMPTLNRYGLNSIPCKANQVWNLLFENLKSSPSLTLLKKEIKLRVWFQLPMYIRVHTHFYIDGLHINLYINLYI